MRMNRTPLLAYRENPVLEGLRYPLLVSPKYDGIRTLRGEDNQAYSRKMKLIPNVQVQEKFYDCQLWHSDGEFIVGSPTEPGCFHRTQSIVMSDDKPAENVRLYLFDYVHHPELPYTRRRHDLIKLCELASDSDVILVPQHAVTSPEEVLKLEEQYVEEGYEGIMLRDPLGRYKWGRSTLLEQYLLKLKRHEDFEVEVLEVIEQMENTNEAKQNEVGRSKRSSAQAGMKPKDTLGGFRVRRTDTGVEFFVGNGQGLTAELRQHLWDVRKKLPGKLLRCRCQPYGVKDKPRVPRLLIEGVRDWRDL